MFQRCSTVEIGGACDRVIQFLEEQGLVEEVEGIRTFIRERAEFREQTILQQEEMKLGSRELLRMWRQTREAHRVARQCLQSWRSLALILQSKQELANIEEELQKIDRMLAEFPWLRAA